MKPTLQALTELARREQRPWSEAIRDYADRGYSWADVAHIVGVRRNTLREFCHYRGMRFPWQGLRSQIQRSRQRDLMLEKGGIRQRAAPRYTVDGITATLSEHALRCGINKNTVQSRLRRGLPLADALATPLMSNYDAGLKGQAELNRRGTRSSHWKQEGQLYGSATDHPRL